MNDGTPAPQTLGRHPDYPAPTLEWPGPDPKPSYWWGRNASGQLTKVYRDRTAYYWD